jgi:hypothetical protein
MSVTARPANAGPARSCIRAATSKNLKFASKVLKKSIHVTLQKDGRSAFTFVPTAAVYWHLDLRPEHFGVPVGAFADPDFPPPTYSVWEESKHAWTRLPDNIEHFPQARV